MMDADRVLRNLGRLLWLGLLLLAPSRLDADEPVVRIVTLGDSITLGVRPGVKQEETFAALLQDALRKQNIPAEVFNKGVGGDQTNFALKRLAKDALALKPRVVTLMYGICDSFGGEKPRLSAEEYRKNLELLVAELRKAGITPILMTPSPWCTKDYQQFAERNKYLERYVQLCREVARETRTPLADHFEHWSKLSAKRVDTYAWTTDSYHLNPRGHREMLDVMLPVLLSVLREEKPKP